VRSSSGLSTSDAGATVEPPPDELPPDTGLKPIVEAPADELPPDTGLKPIVEAPADAPPPDTGCAAAGLTAAAATAAGERLPLALLAFALDGFEYLHGTQRSMFMSAPL
jgi:hypothetical protein